MKFDRKMKVQLPLALGLSLFSTYSMKFPANAADSAVAAPAATDQPTTVAQPAAASQPSVEAQPTVSISNIYLNENKQLVVEFDNPTHITPASPQVRDYPGQQHDIVLEFPQTSFAVDKAPKARVLLGDLMKVYPSLSSIAYATANDGKRARIRIGVSPNVSAHPSLATIGQDSAVINLDLSETTPSDVVSAAPVANKSEQKVSSNTAPATTTAAAAGTTAQPEKGIKGAWHSSIKAGQNKLGQIGKLGDKINPLSKFGHAKPATKLSAPANTDIASGAGPVQTPVSTEATKTVETTTTATVTSTETPVTASSETPVTATTAAASSIVPSSETPVTTPTAAASSIVPSSETPVTTPTAAASSIVPSSETPVTTPTVAASSIVPSSETPVTTPTAAASSIVRSSETPVTTTPAAASSIVPSSETPVTTPAAVTNPTIASSVSPAVVPSGDNTIPIPVASDPAATPVTAVPVTAVPTAPLLSAPAVASLAETAKPDATPSTASQTTALKPEVGGTPTESPSVMLPRIPASMPGSIPDTSSNEPIVTPLSVEQVLKEKASQPIENPNAPIGSSAENSPPKPIVSKETTGDNSVTSDLKTSFSEPKIEALGSPPTSKEKEAEAQTNDKKDEPDKIASALPNSLDSLTSAAINGNSDTATPATKDAAVQLKAQKASKGGKDYLPPKFSDEAVEHYNKAVRLHLDGKLTEAATEYKAASEADPKIAEAFSNLGLIYNQQRQYDMAMTEFHKALAVNPKDAITYNGIGAAMRAKNNMVAAIKNWKTAIALDPNLASAHYNLGTAYELQKDLDQALAEYKEAIKHDDKLGEAYYRMGLILQRMNNKGLALQEYKNAIKISQQATYSADAKRRINLLSQTKNTTM